MASSDIKHLSDRNQILKRPGQHIGSHQCSPKSVFVFDNNTIKEKIVEDYNPGLIHIFYELLSNAQDIFFESKDTDTPLKKIEVTIEDNYITVQNDGLYIPVRLHKYSAEEENVGEVYEAELAFGHLHSSGNYEDKKKVRKGAGLHGVGSKLTNIFSTEFIVETYDPKNQLKFYQKYTKNMETRTKPKITKGTSKTAYTKITYLVDFNYFGIPEQKYSDDLIKVIHKLCIDCAMITGVKVVFNKTPIQIKTPMEYIKLYYTTDNNKIDIKTSDSYFVLVENQDQIQEFKQISFVNGVFTSKGGVHVDEWCKQLFKLLFDLVKKKYPEIKVTFKTIQNYFTIFLFCNLENPHFEGQTKHILSSPKPTVDIPLTKIKNIMKWGWITSIDELALFQNSKELSKMDGSKSTTTKKKIKGYVPATYSGSSKSHLCGLFITEGDSASNIVEGASTFLPNGNDYYGYLSLRGKVLNVRTATKVQLKDNKEILNIIQALGLKPPFSSYDNTVEGEKNFKSLNYGRVIILTDADYDGSHIRGLLLNFFSFFYQGLIDREFIQSIRTPIIRTTIGKTIKNFYYIQDFKEWEKKNTKFKAKYYKGLGTIEDEEIPGIFTNPINSLFTKTDQTMDSIDMIFNKKRANDRKKWLEDYVEEDVHYTIKDKIEIVPITDFLNKEMIQFSMADNKRSIPSLVDGMKPSQRKITWVALNELRQETKVARFGAIVAQKAEYHHGEVSLFDTIINMAQTFPGSNNLTWLAAKGQFGSRKKIGGGAAAPRYLNVDLHSIARKIFRKEDDPLLDYLSEEGASIEPKTFIPIIPLVLINGAAGIGTGYSTNIPSYNPTDIIKWIKEWLCTRKYTKEFEIIPTLDTKINVELIPWYYGINGTTTIENSKIIHTGICTKEKNGYRITDLPPKMWTDAYLEFLDKQLETKKFSDYICKNTVGINIFIKTPNTFQPAELGIQTVENTTNMTVFDKNTKIKKYPTVIDILEEYCIVRYEYYQKRKTYLIQILKTTVKELTTKIKFITECLKNFDLLKQTETELIEWFTTNNYHQKDSEYKYLLIIPIRDFTSDNLQKLIDELSSVKQKIEFIQSTSPSEMWIVELDEFSKEYDKWKNEIKSKVNLFKV